MGWTGALGVRQGPVCRFELTSETTGVAFHLESTSFDAFIFTIDFSGASNLAMAGAAADETKARVEVQRRSR